MKQRLCFVILDISWRLWYHIYIYVQRRGSEIDVLAEYEKSRMCGRTDNIMKIGFVSLGCPKNQLDTEVMLHEVLSAGYEITQDEIDLYANTGKRPYDEIIYYGSYEEIQEYCQINNWTDGLPVVPPTDEKIKEYLEFTPYAPDHVLGTYALAYRECTVYTVAANAVMAGVPKEYMPLCIAFVEGMNNGEWRRPLASTHGWSPYAWLNGPVARQLGIDHGQGMISEKNNKALGRFIDLAMLNIGGYYVKENRMGTFGYLSAWTFSEDEAACLEVGWNPYHVTKGYELNDNTLTAAWESRLLKVCRSRRLETTSNLLRFAARLAPTARLRFLPIR